MSFKIGDKKQTKLCNESVDKMTTKILPDCCNNLNILENVINLIWKLNIHSLFFIFWGYRERAQNPENILTVAYHSRKCYQKNVQHIQYNPLNVINWKISYKHRVLFQINLNLIGFNVPLSEFTLPLYSGSWNDVGEVDVSVMWLVFRESIEEKTVFDQPNDC